MGLGGTSFRLQERIPPSFVNITGRIENKLNFRNSDTMVVVAAKRRASDFLASIHGSDFDNLWTEGEEFPLAFKCLPKIPIPRSSGMQGAPSSTKKGCKIQYFTWMRLTRKCPFCG